jgi:hypothetical protein
MAIFWCEYATQRGRFTVDYLCVLFVADGAKRRTPEEAEELETLAEISAQLPNSLRLWLNSQHNFPSKYRLQEPYHDMRPT